MKAVQKATGMAEIREYQRAETLGLMSWDLFLNLGLARLENGDLGDATDSLRRAVLLGGDHSESHFNPAPVDERRGTLTDAEHETGGVTVESEATGRAQRAGCYLCPGGRDCQRVSVPERLHVRPA